MAYKRNSIRDLQTSDVQVFDPITKASTGLVITLAGPENPVRKSVELATQRRVRAQLLENGGKLKLPDPLEEEQDALDRLVACTVGWTGLQDEGGADVPFSTAAATVLYTEEPWLRAQVLGELNTRERFIKGSAPN